jgi:hypothetical protein
MKAFIWIAGLSCLVSVTSVFADEVDFGRSNVVLQALTDAVVAGDDMVDFAKPQFDEAYSSLKDEKLKYNVQGALNNTPWLDGGHADVQVSSTYAADRSTGHTGIAMNIGTTVKTDAMSLVRYTAAVALAKRSNDDPVFVNRIIAHLQRLSVAHSLDDVYALLVSGQTLAEEMIQAKIDRFNQTIANPATPPGDIDYLKKEIASWQVILNGYKSVQVVTEKSAGGNVTKVTVSCEDGSPFTSKRPEWDAKAGRTVLMITADHFTASMDIFVSRTTEKLDESKTQLQSRLIGLQNGTADDKESVQNTLRDALISFKRVVRGQNHY